MKEFEYRGETISVNKSTNSLVIHSPRFKATLAELETLYYVANGFHYGYIAHHLNVREQTLKDNINKLKNRNSTLDSRPNLPTLIRTAYDLELLFPPTLNKLFSMYEEAFGEVKIRLDAENELVP